MKGAAGTRGLTIMDDNDDWQAQDDARTLMRAQQIKNDPARHSKAKAHAASQVKAMKQVAGQPGPGMGGPVHDVMKSGYRKL